MERTLGSDQRNCGGTTRRRISGTADGDMEADKRRVKMGEEGDMYRR
jgi:hypothetical protein